MQLGQTTQYKAAIEALSKLRDEVGNTTPELQAIAAYLFYTNKVQAPSPLFPFVGVGDVRDLAVVQAYEQAWQQFVTDENTEDE